MLFVKRQLLQASPEHADMVNILHALGLPVEMYFAPELATINLLRPTNAPTEPMPAFDAASVPMIIQQIQAWPAN
jgi:hypothetical protein